MMETSPLPARALLNAALLAIILRRAAIQFDVLADVVQWVTGCAVVSLAVWAMKEDKDRAGSIAKRILDALALERIASRRRWLGSAAAAVVAVYALLLPSISIACADSASLHVERDGVVVRDVQCQEGRHVVFAPSGVWPSWGAAIHVDDDWRRFAVKELSPIRDNLLEYPKDFRYPPAVLLQLWPAAAIEAGRHPAGETEAASCGSSAYCFRRSATDRGIVVPAEGLLFGASQTSPLLLADRNAILNAGGAPFDSPLGTPTYVLAYRPSGTKVEGWLQHENGSNARCAKVTCPVKPDGETVCALPKDLDFGPCP